MHVTPFYGPWRGIAAEDVWHNNDACPIGQRIPQAARMFGTDHIRLRCARCMALGLPAALAPTAPEPT